jgi:hypothetical protein
VEPTHAFEAFARSQGITIKHYHADNGRLFAANHADNGVCDDLGFVKEDHATRLISITLDVRVDV